MHRILKKMHLMIFEFDELMILSSDINFCIESVCQSSEGKEFLIVGAVKENE